MDVAREQALRAELDDAIRDRARLDAVIEYLQGRLGTPQGRLGTPPGGDSALRGPEALPGGL